jgi:hypothetical protein
MCLSTIDCAILANPFEVVRPQVPSTDEFYHQLAKAFEFYEKAA